MNYLALFNKLELDFFKKDKYIDTQYVLFKLNLEEEYISHFKTKNIHYGDVYLNRDTKEMFVFVFKEVSTNFYDSHYFYGFEFISTTIYDDVLEVNNALSLDEMLNIDIKYVGNIILGELIVSNHIEMLNKDKKINKKQINFIKSLRNLIIQKLDLIFIYYKTEMDNDYLSVNNLRKAKEEDFLEVKESIKKNGFLLLCNILKTKILVSALCMLENDFGFVTINEKGEIIFLSRNGEDIEISDSILIKKIYNYYNISEMYENNRRENIQEEKEIYKNHFLYLVSQI